MGSMTDYNVLRMRHPPEMKGLWDGPVWQNVPPLNIACFRPESSSHRPLTQCKLCYGLDRIWGLFRVDDRYVRCIHQGFQAEVYKDSCVEFFVEPKAGAGYFNFEFNGGGAMLASHVTDPTRVAGRVKGCTPLPPEKCRRVEIFHSLPARVEPEITEPIVWFLEFSIPVSIFEPYIGSIGNMAGQVWRANFYKCGNETSRPHWAAWQPVNDLNFHLPEHFGSLRFAGIVI